jgi:transcriptional regulator with XRE-family HTH domain
MKHTDNYRLQVEGAKKYFLRYDQQALIEKLDLHQDADYLYTEMLCTQYRIHRKSGNVERLDNTWTETNSHSEVMTLLDLVCDSRPDRYPARRWQNMTNFGKVFHRSLMEDHGLTQEDAAKRVGKSRPAVTNALRLLNLNPEVLDKVRTGELTAGHARAILTVKSEKKQLAAAQKIAALGLSVRQAELLCRNMDKEPAPVKQEVTLKVDYVAECEKQLSKQLGRGVKIVNGKRKGRFELEFYGPEDLQVLLDALMKIQK